MKETIQKESLIIALTILLSITLVVISAIMGYHLYEENCALKKIHVLEYPVQLEFKMIQSDAEAVLNDYSECKDTKERLISLSQHSARLSSLTDLYSFWSYSDVLPLPFGIDNKDWLILTHFCGNLQNYLKIVIESGVLSEGDISNLYGIMTIMEECDRSGDYTPILELDETRIKELEITFLDIQVFTID